MKLAKYILASALSLLIAAGAYQANAYTEYEVKKNDTLYGIAYKFKVSADDIIKLNPKAKRGVKKGQIILIPDGHEGADEKQTPATQPTENEVEQIVAPADETPKPDAPTSDSTVPEYIFSKPGDTFRSISVRHGLSEDDLIALNPFLDPYLLTPDTYVRLRQDSPLSLDSDSDMPYQEESPDGSEPKPIDPGDLLGDFEILSSDSTYVDGRTNAMLLLPFHAVVENPSKRAQQYADFYRGFLLGAQEVSPSIGAEVEVYVYDTDDDAAKMASLLSEIDDKNISVVIAPEDQSQLSQVIDSVTSRGIYVLNLFNVKDNAQADNDHVLQYWINQDLMYAKALDALVSDFEGYTPVILSPKDGKAEKEPFINALRQRYAELGLEVIDLSFEDGLDMKDLKFIEPDGKYVFIPKSGTLNVFNRFASAIYTLRNQSDDASRFRVFGYPDWTAFRNDSRETLHFLDAVIYSRFFLDEEQPEVKSLQNAFTHWYGNPMLEAVPNQAILGYDTAIYLLTALKRHPGRIGEYFNSDDYVQGLQSTFDFRHLDNQGFINQALYLIEFMPGNQLFVKVL